MGVENWSHVWDRTFLVVVLVLVVVVVLVAVAVVVVVVLESEKMKETIFWKMYIFREASLQGALSISKKALARNMSW